MKKLFLLFVIGLVCSALYLLHFEPSNAQNIADKINMQASVKPIDLFELIGTLRMQSSLSIAGVREQNIKINFDKVNFETATKLHFQLLDGKRYEAVRRETEGFERFAQDTYSWRGKIFGENDWSGDVILSVHKNAMAGSIYLPSGVYSIIPQANGAHVLVEINQSLFPDNNDDVQIVNGGKTNLFSSEANVFGQISELFGKSASNNRHQPLSPQLDNGSQIDVMIVYTDDVRAFLGGTTQAIAFAQSAITTANTVYQNSAITPRLRLVHTMEVNYTESSNSNTHLNFINSDPTIAAARNTFKADAVGFFTETSEPLNCGRARLMENGNHNAAFESSAFSVSKRDCAVDRLTFPHELGHNQGANHDPANGLPPAQAVFTYAFGHFNVAANFRTVMSTDSNACSTCPRVAHFSNPLVNYNGVPTGQADRNNAATINNTALVFSRFRDSGLPDLTITAGTQYVTPTTAPAGSIVTVGASEDNSGTSAAGPNIVSLYLSTDAVLTPGSNGDTYIGLIQFPSIPANSNSLSRSKFH